MSPAQKSELGTIENAMRDYWLELCQCERLQPRVIEQGDLLQVSLETCPAASVWSYENLSSLDYTRSYGFKFQRKTGKIMEPMPPRPPQPEWRSQIGISAPTCPRR